MHGAVGRFGVPDACPGGTREEPATMVGMRLGSRLPRIRVDVRRERTIEPTVEHGGDREQSEADGTDDHPRKHKHQNDLGHCASPPP